MRFSRTGKSLRRSIVAASMLAASGAAVANDRQIDCRGDLRMCETVIAGERDLTSMMTSGDIGAITRVFAEDAVWSLGDGTRQTRSEAIAGLRNAPKMASSQLLHLDVRQFGTIAIVLWKESWRAPGADHDEISFGTDTWMLRARRWQIIASQESHAPAKPTP